MKPSDLIWAKSGDESQRWLPLWLHLRDTFQISAWIWDNRMPAKHKQMFSQDFDLEPNEVKKIYQLACGLHDLGKSTPDFSGRESVVYTTTPLHIRMKEAGFDYRSFALYRGDSSSIRHEVASEFFLREILTSGKYNPKNAAFLSIIAAHHGKPVSINSDIAFAFKQLQNNAADTLWVDSIAEIYEFITLQFDDSFELLSHVANHGLTWRSQMIMSAYLSMADWLASSDDLFPLWNFHRVEGKSWDTDKERLDDAIDALSFPQLFNPELLANEIRSTEEIFGARFGFTALRPAQKDLVDLVRKETTEASDIFILEAPMGEGKTEAALVAAEILMYRSGSTGIFFGLPTMATGEAIYSRFIPYLESLLDETNQHATLDLMHSKAFLSETRREISGKAYYNTSDSGIVDSGWFSGRYLKMLNSFVVGTVDNFLMLQLPLKYAYWRHLGLSQKVIIIDEVHSMDETMKHFLIEGLRVAGFYDCPVILASATLKKSERISYLSAYTEGKELGKKVTNVED